MSEPIRLRLKGKGSDWRAHYPDDIADFQRILRAAGYEASGQDVETAWDNYSESMAAGWMYHDQYSDEFVLSALLDSLEPDTTPDRRSGSQE